jgi:hypothetical protein
MGISQVPPVPVPTAKGDLIVGTATGPVRLPVGTTANQALLVDSTTATGLKYNVIGLAATTQLAPAANRYAVTNFSYTNPNLTYTAAGHEFLAGHYVMTNGIAQTGTTGSPVRGSTVTAVSGSTSYTYNIGTSGPGTYSNGGTAFLRMGGNPSLAKYVNNVYFVGTNTGSYFYSTDGITWLAGQVPTKNQPILSIDWDGTTYAIAAGYEGIWTSATLASNSWVRRSNFGTVGTNWCSDIKWCAGIARWVACGGTGGSSSSGTRIETAASGAVTWTNQTISGTNSYVSKGIGYDGVNTVVIGTNGHGPFVSTGGASFAFTGYPTATTTSPDSNTSGVNGLNEGVAPSTILWNPVASKWMGLGASTPALGSGVSTAGSPATVWTREIQQQWFNSTWGANSDDHGGNTRHPIIYDSTAQVLRTYSYSGSNFTAYSWSATPTVLSANAEVYPLVQVQTAYLGLGSSWYQTAAGTGSGSFGGHTACYGNGKWVLLTSQSDRGFPGQFLITTMS